MKRNSVAGKYFFGHEISEYGQKNGHVDYRTLAQEFDAVMCNDIISKTQSIGYWEQVNGSEEYYEDGDGNTYTYEEAQERKEALEEQQEALDEEEQQEQYNELQEEIERMEDAHYRDIFQYFIIDSNGADILQEYTDEIVWYNEELDMYVWGVTHWGTAWDYVLTDIRCNAGYEDEEDEEDEDEE